MTVTIEGQDPDEDDEHAGELHWDCFWQFFGCANPQFHQLSGWLVSDHPASEEAGFGGPGLVWLHLVYGCEAGWTYSTAKFPKTTLEAANGRDINIQFSGNSSGGYSCSQNANYILL